MDRNRRGWALRYLREAIDEIKIVKKDERAFDLVVDALRKAQMAVYCSLGDPSVINDVISEMIESGLPQNNPILKFLVEIERSINYLEEVQHTYVSDIFLKESERLIMLASQIVNVIMSLYPED